MAKFKLTIRQVLYIINCFLITWTISTKPCPADEIDQAKAKFEQGASLIIEKDYLNALSAFQKSYSIRPKALVLYNIAMCQKELKRNIEAIASFKRYLDEAGEAPESDLLSKARTAISELESLVSKLTIEGTPEKAKLTIDNKLIGLFSPKQPILLEPGQHKIRIFALGYLLYAKTVTAIPGTKTALAIHMSHFRARVKLRCGSEKEAIVYLDGEIVGICPYESEVDPGEHLVRVEVPNKKVFVQKINLSAGQNADIEVEFEPIETDIVTLPEKKPSIEQPIIEKKKSISRRLIVSITTMALGACAASVGLAFNIRGFVDNAELEKYERRWIKDENRTEHDDNYYKYWELSNEKLPYDRIGMAISYTAAGVLAFSGVVIFILEKRKKPDREESSLELKAGGVGLTF
ncbi:MAG: PEGA domain-containing protein [Proteobacteria bacterium]|nr:PEGA domain-containing protein [Pseudomonadota bacterium]